MQKILSLLATALLISGLAFYNQNEEAHSFKTWQKKFNKFYTQNEEIYRQIIFNQNVELINKHNSNPNKSYSMAINQFADLTDEEFQSMYLGKPTYVKTDNIELSKGNNLGDADWASRMNPIKNQGNCGSCWTFSAVGAVEGFLIIRKGFKGVLSEQQLVDCAVDAGEGCNGGNSDLALDYIAEVGSVYERDYEYTAKDGVCKVKQGKVRISGRENYGPNEDAIKKGIQNYPLSVSVDATYWKFYNQGVYDGACRDDFHNHAVVAVGFDYAGNWKIRNSWGEGWGEQGHIWLKPGNSCAVMTRVDGAI
ncbi:unnamed protein product [Paramecium octaurelia]|uniref:cathepsin L n=1 Tax=Paramecium octaurelia TaxID=43137 RepID=A0A8S1UYU2_PAROT|nr:unnamed protein product [Paramecium octaurelia]